MLFRVPRAEVLAYLDGKIKANLRLAERVRAKVSRSPMSDNLTQSITAENDTLEFMRKYLHADQHDCVTLSSEDAKFLKYLKPCECDACVAEKRAESTGQDAGEPGARGSDSTRPSAVDPTAGRETQSDDLEAEDGPFSFKPFDASDLAASTSIHAEELPADMLPAG